MTHGTPSGSGGIVRALARAIDAAGTDTVPAAAIHQAQLLLLDTIGCGLAARGDAVAEAVTRLALNLSGASTCAIIGRRRKTDVLNAVLVNGAAIRVLDLNDYLVGESKGQPETAGHPSDNIPVALACGAERGRSGIEILAAIVMGYELYARLQRLMSRSRGWDGVTASGLVAAAIAGRLIGLDEYRLAHALALGAARAATPAIVRTGHISAAKSIGNALVAQAGVQAALLAEQGLTGPLPILDDARGLCGMFGEEDAATLLSAPFDDGGAILRAHVKTFPCVNTGQSAVAAALALRARIGGHIDSIERIEAIMADYPVTKRHQEDPVRLRPGSREAADHSFPFLIAVALIDGALGAAQFQNERWKDPKVAALMAKIHLRRDREWNGRAPGAFPCTLRSWNSGGDRLEVEVPYPPGYSNGELDERLVIEKFHSVAERVLSREDRQVIVDATMDFHHTRSTATLDTAIAKEGAFT